MSMSGLSGTMPLITSIRCMIFNTIVVASASPCIAKTHHLDRSDRYRSFCNDRTESAVLVAERASSSRMRFTSRWTRDLATPRCSAISFSVRPALVNSSI
jgi:hypothetical protein